MTIKAGSDSDRERYCLERAIENKGENGMSES